MSADPSCFYCHEPIEPGPGIVAGVNTLAHRRCVRRELDQRLGADWERRHTDCNRASAVASKREALKVRHAD